MNAEFAIAVHGGAGALDETHMPPHRLTAMRGGIRAALTAGRDILEAGGSSVDAVEAAVKVLENDPIFNAGRGAVLAADRKHYLDAAIMRGSDRAAGAAAHITTVKNPILLARTIMEKGKEVLVVGEPAEQIAAEAGLQMVDNSFFTTELRIQQLQRAMKSDAVVLDHHDFKGKKGTVGAVAIDSSGHLAAATSTGGLTNKHPGRVGDTPLIGTGTYASDKACAISATGVGEIFIREHVAARIADLIQDAGKTISSAASYVMEKVLPKGVGGLIGISPDGEIVLPFTSKGMARGSVRAGEEEFIAIGREGAE